MASAATAQIGHRAPGDRVYLASSVGLGPLPPTAEARVNVTPLARRSRVNWEPPCRTFGGRAIAARLALTCPHGIAVAHLAHVRPQKQSQHEEIYSHYSSAVVVSGWPRPVPLTQATALRDLGIPAKPNRTLGAAVHRPGVSSAACAGNGIYEAPTA